MKFKHRDVSITSLDNKYLIVACDSCGAVGEKKEDVVKAPVEITAEFTTRLCIMEVMSLGAEVKTISLNICNELNSTGERMIKAVEDKFQSLDFEIIVSTEKNLKTSMTALGVTAIGISENLMLNKIQEEAYVYVFGVPSVGQEVIENKDKIADVETLIKIREEIDVLEIIPTGSRGIKAELKDLEKAYDKKIDYVKELKVDLKKSCGPSTALIGIFRTKKHFDIEIPVFEIGKIKNSN